MTALTALDTKRPSRVTRPPFDVVLRLPSDWYSQLVISTRAHSEPFCSLELALVHTVTGGKYGQKIKF